MRSPLLVRWLYTYTFLPVWVVLLTLALSVIMQIFFHIMLPAVRSLGHVHSVSAAGAPLVLLLVLPVPLVKLMSNALSLVYDAWSPLEHPYARHKLRELSFSRSHAANVLIPFAVACGLPSAIDAAFDLFLSGRREMLARRAIHGLAILCEAGLLHGVLAYVAHHFALFGHSIAACGDWQARAIARGKVLHLVGCVGVALYVAGVSSPLQTLSWTMVVSAMSAGLATGLFLLLKILVDLKRACTGAFDSPHSPLVWIGAALGGVCIAALMWTYYRTLAAPAAAVCLYVASLKQLLVTTVHHVQAPQDLVHERSHLRLAMLGYRLLLYVLVGVILALLFAATMQEANIASPCAPHEKISSVSQLVLGAGAGAPGPEAPTVTMGHARARPGRYAICEMSYGGIDIVDAALLADFATDLGLGTCYQRNFERIFAELFDASDWSVRGEAVLADNVGFVDMYSASRNLSVIGVRGTVPHRFLDIVQDLDLFSVPAALQLASAFVPLTVWPQEALAELVHAGSILHGLFASEQRHYYSAVERYVRSITDRTVLLTGHSLGGVIAKIVGARLGLRAIAFSSPGLSLSRFRFNISQSAINHLLINVVPNTDLVPLVDAPAGMIQQIDCTASAQGCHSMERTVCELAASCGQQPSSARRHSRLHCAAWSQAHGLYEG